MGRQHRPVRDGVAVDPVLHSAGLRPGRKVEQQEARIFAPASDGEVLACRVPITSDSELFGVPPMPRTLLPSPYGLEAMQRLNFVKSYVVS